MVIVKIKQTVKTQNNDTIIIYIYSANSDGSSSSSFIP